MSETEEPRTKPPSLFRNYISFVGAAIATAAFLSIVLLFLVEIGFVPLNLQPNLLRVLETG